MVVASPIPSILSLQRRRTITRIYCCTVASHGELVGADRGRVDLDRFDAADGSFHTFLILSDC